MKIKKPCYIFKRKRIRLIIFPELNDSYILVSKDEVKRIGLLNHIENQIRQAIRENNIDMAKEYSEIKKYLEN